MSFLDIKDNKVFVTEEGHEIPAVVSLYNADKTESKKFYNDSIAYVFYVYKRDGVYSDTFEDNRKKLVMERHFPDRKIDHFESNKRVRELIAEYLDRQMSKLERFYYQLEKDMEALMTQITNIPYQKKAKAQVPFRDQDGVETKVTAEIVLDNYEEKAKAIMMAEKLIDYADKLKAKIIKENMQKRKNPGQRLFDK